MPVLFEDEAFRVRQGWLTGWRVDDLERNVTYVPTHLMTEKIGLIWPVVVRRTSKTGIPPRRFTEDILFALFANAVADPDNKSLQVLFRDTASNAAEEVILRASEAYRNWVIWKTMR